MRIAIITRNSNSWVYKLAWELFESQNQLLIVNQQRAAGPPPWRNRGFVRRRGLVAFLDLWLQAMAARLADAKRGSDTEVGPDGSERDREIRQFDPDQPAAYAATLAAMRARVEAGERRPDWWDVDTVNSEEVIAKLSGWGPDVILLCAAPIIRKRFFKAFPLVINPHCGIVPEYKGSSPMHWAVYRRDFERIGYTIHLATPEVDGGPIIEQQRVTPLLGWDLTAIDWYLVFSMYKRIVELIKSGEIVDRAKRAEAQPPGGNTWPPMGLLRTWLAGRRLRRHQAQAGGLK